MKSLCFTSLFLAPLALARALPHTHAEHERRDVDIQGSLYVKRSRLDDMVLPVRIGLVHAHELSPLDLLMHTADPSSIHYGKRYTGEEINELFAPSLKAVQAVRDWLTQSNISEHRISHSYNKQWLQFDASTAEVEDLLHTDYWHYEHPASGRTFVGCDNYHLPRHIQEHVDYITPAVKTLEARQSGAPLQKRASPGRHPHTPLPFPVEMTEGPNAQVPCYEAVTPDCIRQMYNITDKTLVNKGSSLGIYEFGDFLRKPDLDLFLKHYMPSAAAGAFPTVKDVDGAPKLPDKLFNSKYYRDGIDGESSLDVAIAYPLFYPNEIDLFQVDDFYYESYDFESGDGRWGLFNTFLDALDGSYCNYSAYGETGDSPTLDPVYPDTHHNAAISKHYPTPYYKHPHQCGVYTPPGVITMSYAWAEIAYPANYAKRQCNEFAKLVMQGTTIVESSGDDGVTAAVVNGVGEDGCINPDGKIFNPNSASNCPAVLSVGATQLQANVVPGKQPERAVDKFYSGGGFSNYFPTPSYQKTAVANYLAKHAPSYKSYNVSAKQTVGYKGGIYNRGGRGYPDVSAVGQNITTYFDNKPYLNGGTSASSPLIAGLIARINSYRLAAGKKTIGFVHPIFYKHPEVFTDVTVGKNPGCETQGFYCVEGWDPVTGLGTPRYPELKALLLAQP